MNLMKTKPVSRGFYAFNTLRAGDFLLYVESDNHSHKFLYLPGAHYFYLTEEDFSIAIQTNVLSFVEQLPENIYKESLELACPLK